MRIYWTLIHRYIGLVMAGFLLLAGVTGSLLAWYGELDAWVNPSMMKVPPPTAAATPLSPLQLRERVQAAYPNLGINNVPLTMESDRALRFVLRGTLDLSTGKPAKLVNDEVFVNPYTGDITGARKWGDITQGMTNLLPFIYRLHYTLALGDTGELIFGIVAVLWTLDCFVGAYLTLPAKRRADKANAHRHARAKKPAGNGATWLSRWKPAWLVRWLGGSYKVNFDLHRAGGLWVWAMLFVLAWSSVAFNLGDQVYLPVMKSTFSFADEDNIAKLAEPQATPGMPWAAALPLARKHMSDEARRQRFTVIAEQSLRYDPKRGIYRYFVKSSLDIRDKSGSTGVYFDANNGALKFTSLPTGHYAGDTVTLWLTSLHMAKVWGLPMRIFVCVMGVIVAMLSVTGVIIWWRKRSSRRHYVAKQGRAQALLR